MEKERWKIMEGIEIFQGLKTEELQVIATICHMESYKAGQRIFAENSLGQELYVLTDGQVGIDLAAPGETKFATVHIVGEGQIFGELALVDQGPRSATAKSMTNCQVLVIPRDKLYQLFEKDNHIGYVVIENIARVLAARLRKTNLQLISSFLWR